MSENRRYYAPLAFYWIAGTLLLLVGISLGILTIRTFDTSRNSTNRPSIVERVELGAKPASRTAKPNQVVIVDPAQLSSMFKDAANSVRRSVVFIQVTISPTEESWYQNIENRFFEDNFDRQSVGSGVVISTDGYIVTNHHVVAGAKEIKVTLDDKREYVATIVGSDPATDLAVIKINEPTPLAAVPLGDSDIIEVGEWVLAIGNPFRLTSTVTAGIVSALGRQVNIIDSRFGVEDFIQTDAAINPGNSGGALVNLSGELIGINTAIATESGASEGYGFAVPVRLVERVVADLILYGEVKRGYLGVEIQAVDAAVAQRLGMNKIEGVFLNTVQQGGAAHQAGLRKGDIILQIGDAPVNAPNELQSAVARKRPGDLIQVSVWRRDKTLDIQVTLAGADDPVTSSWLTELDTPPEAPDITAPEFETQPYPEIEDVQALGLGLSDISENLQEEFGIDEGAFISFVQNGSVADRAGLERGRIVTSINRESVSSASEAAERFDILDSGAPILVETVRANGIKEYFEILP
ncbi:MAG: PDZ domain-containing protein [Rhodothermales bacterium]|nr:PDZ domain-containing protein [Rhodothermales bacterium]